MIQQLYRHFDKDGNLLYVGISLSAIERLRQHREESKWFKEIATITIQNFKSREDVKLAEMQAINSENPKYNKVRTVPPIHTCDEPTSTDLVIARVPEDPGPFIVKRVSEILNTNRGVVLELIRVGILDHVYGEKPIKVSKQQLVEYITRHNMDCHV